MATTIKTVKVSDKGQISIPLDIRESIGINRGDELIIIQDDNKIFIEKANSVSKKIIDDFKDIRKHSEKSLSKIWDNEQDNIWSTYIK